MKRILSANGLYDAVSALLTWTPTAIGQTAPGTQILEASGGIISFDLGATPVFIEAACAEQITGILPRFIPGKEFKKALDAIEFGKA